MLIEKSGLKQNTLAAKTVILTGAGGGIGFETARALIWLGANVILAEIDAQKGTAAEERINRELGCTRAEFYRIDLSDEAQIEKIVRYAKEKYGFIDVVFNNATMIAIGAVEDVSAAQWDKSYAVNLRAPLLLTQKLLPDMKRRNSGTVIFVSSSGAAPYMGAYEVFKTAQVELSSTLSGELEGTNVNTLTIGPGLVKTDTAVNGIKTIATLMGMSTDDFYKLNEAHMLSPEEAGLGFALAVVYAEKYSGQEISSIQVLHDADIAQDNDDSKKTAVIKGDTAALALLIKKAADTYCQQYDGWLRRNVFERQWVLRDFKKSMGVSAEQFKDLIENIRGLANSSLFDKIPAYKNEFEKLKAYYERQYKLLQGFEKDPQKLKETSKIVMSWIDNAREICALL